MLKGITHCFGCMAEQEVGDEPTPGLFNSQKTYTYSTEKMIRYEDEPVKYSESDVAHEVIAVLLQARSRGADLQVTLENIVRETGWWDNAICEAVLAALEKTLQAAGSNGPALQKAYDKAKEEAEKMVEFAGEHPVLTGVFCTVVAIGVLWLLWPAIVEALGFGELGPIEGMLT